MFDFKCRKCGVLMLHAIDTGDYVYRVTGKMVWTCMTCGEKWCGPEWWTPGGIPTCDPATGEQRNPDTWPVRVE
jgi:hypothetical protein